MKERTQYIHDSFVDYKGREHHFVICAVSKLLPRNYKEYIEQIKEDRHGIDLESSVESYIASYAFDYGILDDDIKVVKSVSIGMAICNPEDKFDYNVGCKKAYARANNSDATLFATKAGLINTRMVTALLVQESEYFKNNPNSRIPGYRDGEIAYLEKKKKENIANSLTEEAKKVGQFLKNCSTEMLNAIKEVYNV